MSNVDLITKPDTPDYKLWLNAVLDNPLLSIIALKAVRDENGVIIDFEYAFINKKAEESVNRSGLTGKRFLEEFPGGMDSGLFDHYVDVTETGTPWDDEIFYNYNGYEFWCSVKAIKLDDGCLVMYDEITKRKKAHQELLNLKEIQTRKASDKYLSLFNSIDEAFCIIEVIFNENEVAVDYRFLEVNPAFKKLTGLEDVIGKSARELVPGIEEYWFPIYGNVAKTGIPVRFEDKAGQVYEGVWYDLYAFRIDSSGQNHVAVLFNDITQRKKAEQQLKDFNTTLENLVEDRTAELKENVEFIEEIASITPDLISIQDVSSGRIVYYNRPGVWKKKVLTERFFNATEVQRTELLIHPDDRGKALDFSKKRCLLNDGEILEIELRTLSGSHDDIEWTRVRSKVFKRNADGSAKEIISFTSNITDTKKAEQKIIEQAHLISQIMEVSPDYVIVYDLEEQKIEYLNRDIYSALGYTKEDTASEQHLLDKIIHPDDIQKLVTRFNDLNLRPQDIIEQEYRLKDTEGKWHSFNVRDAFFKAGADGKLKQVLSIIRDITEKRETEKAYQTEKSVNEELRRMNQVMDTFVYSAAHDLKAPVSNLKLLTEVIESIDDKEQKLKFQSQYPSHIRSLDQVISGLIDVLAIEKNPGSIKDLYFHEIFTEVSKELQVNFAEAHPEVTLDFSACTSICYIESYLVSIFRNMLTNAIKYRSDERKLQIGIRSWKEDQYVVLSFGDNGIGIDLPAYGNDLFKPFKRFTDRSQGSGIGLHLIKSMVTKNGGTIDVESETGKGTTFTICLVPYNE